MKTKIEVFTEGQIAFPFGGLTRSEIHTYLKRIAAILSLNDVSLSLILTDNEYIHGINRKYLQRDRPTDVISFSYRDDPFPLSEGMVEHLGDIYLSLEMALENSGAYDVAFIDEVKRLMVHGILHLIGYDHELSDEEDRKMREKEETILKLLK